MNFATRRKPELPRRPLGTVLLLAFAFVLAACVPSEDENLRIAVNPWPGYSYFAVAEAQGIFAHSDGLDVEIIETASLGDSLRAFERGQVDLIGGTLAELADINAHGRRPAKAILILDRSVGGDMIVANRSITTLGDLEGKRIALEPASANVLVLATAAEQSDLDLDQVTLVPLPQGEMPAALEKHKIDAAITYPPVAQRLLDLPDTHRLFDTSHNPNAVVDVLIAANEVINAQPRALARLVTAHDQALAWSQDHPDAARRIIARHSGLSLSELTSLESAIEMLTIDEQQPMWSADGPLPQALMGSSAVLAQLHDHQSPAREQAEQMLDATFVRDGATQ